MGRLSYHGVETLISAMSDLANLPDSVTDEILGAEAAVIADAQQAEAAKKWVGHYATGTTARSIARGKIKKVGLKKTISIFPQGKNVRGSRNAEVAFINEYGKKGQPARSAIRVATIAKEKEAVEAGEKVYHTYLDSKNL